MRTRRRLVGRVRRRRAEYVAFLTASLAGAGFSARSFRTSAMSRFTRATSVPKDGATTALFRVDLRGILRAGLADNLPPPSHLLDTPPATPRWADHGIPQSSSTCSQLVQGAVRRRSIEKIPKHARPTECEFTQLC